MTWTMFCKRTEDPKLAYLESRLTEAGIAHRRNGASWHAPILEVHEADLAAADAILAERRGRYRLDDVRDDHPSFLGYTPHDFDPDAEAAEEQSLDYFNHFIAGDR